MSLVQLTIAISWRDWWVAAGGGVRPVAWPRACAAFLVVVAESPRARVRDIVVVSEAAGGGCQRGWYTLGNILKIKL